MHVFFCLLQNVHYLFLPKMKNFSHRMFEAMRSKVEKESGLLPLDTFIETALYHPQLGYYTQPERQRVGRNAASDFYTAASLGTVFAKLVFDAICQCLPFSPSECTFVEFGPETSAGIFGNLKKNFKDHQLVRPNQLIDIPPKAVVFSNELFDAQPFRRFQFTEDRWLEAFVRPVLSSEDIPQYECVYDAPSSPIPNLPQNSSPGYIIDWPSGAHQLLQSICEKSWEGLFIAFDYGLPESVVLNERPQGTARTYKNHHMGNAITEDPGTRDITCHLVWDHLQQVLNANDFTQIALTRQETFFMTHAKKEIERIITEKSGQFSDQRMTLMELLHPENLGSRFQVLTAIRNLS